ncbi:hypothetical protein BJ741DRAFT_672115 [Chytriomyces cf. hyalinus JEL632]|nr:hypothetical protein BJ741DRAFT_672115 [Chytriomyces cf. hyalinus JEL632]
MPTDAYLPIIFHCRLKRNIDRVPMVKHDKLEALCRYTELRWSAQTKKDAGVFHRSEWSNDSVIRKKRFCCIQREHDATSKVMKDVFQHIDPLDPRYMFNLWFLRYLSNVTAVREFGYVTDVEMAVRKLKAYDDEDSFAGKKKVSFRPSCFISSDSTKSVIVAVRANWKVSIKHSANWFSRARSEKFDDSAQFSAKRRLYTFMEHHMQLCGKFHAFQDANDAVMYGAIPDDSEFCRPGPGALKALRSLGFPPTEMGVLEVKNRLNRRLEERSDSGIAVAVISCNCSAAKKTSGTCFNAPLPALSVVDVEHTLCEFQKYERYRLAECRKTSSEPSNSDYCIHDFCELVHARTLAEIPSCLRSTSKEVSESDTTFENADAESVVTVKDDDSESVFTVKDFDCEDLISVKDGDCESVILVKDDESESVVAVQDEDLESDITANDEECGYDFSTKDDDCDVMATNACSIKERDCQMETNPGLNKERDSQTSNGEFPMVEHGSALRVKFEQQAENEFWECFAEIDEPPATSSGQSEGMFKSSSLNQFGFEELVSSNMMPFKSRKRTHQPAGKYPVKAKTKKRRRKVA